MLIPLRIVVPDELTSEDEGKISISVRYPRLNHCIQMYYRPCTILRCHKDAMMQIALIASIQPAVRGFSETMPTAPGKKDLVV